MINEYNTFANYIAVSCSFKCMPVKYNHYVLTHLSKYQTIEALHVHNNGATLEHKHAFEQQQWISQF